METVFIFVVIWCLMLVASIIMIAFAKIPLVYDRLRRRRQRRYIRRLLERNTRAAYGRFHA